MARLARYDRAFGKKDAKVNELAEKVSEKLKVVHQKVEEGLQPPQVGWGAGELLLELSMADSGLDLLADLEALELGVEELTIGEELGLGSLGALDLDECLCRLHEPHALEEEAVTMVDQTVLEERRMALWAEEPQALMAPAMVLDELEALELVPREPDWHSLLADAETQTAADSQLGSSLATVRLAIESLKSASEEECRLDMGHALVELVRVMQGLPPGQIPTLLQTARAQTELALGSSESSLELSESSRSVLLILTRADQLIVAQQKQEQAEKKHTALFVGKEIVLSVAQLSRGELAGFDSGDEIPNGFAGSMEAMRPRAQLIASLLLNGPSSALLLHTLYVLNCVKHVASGFIRGNESRLTRLMELCRAWAAELVRSMKDFEQNEPVNVETVDGAVQRLIVFVETEVLLTCHACQVPLSGRIATVDGINYHLACFEADDAK